MPKVVLDNNSFELDSNESVLDCLLRHQQAIAYACKSGACQSCLCKAVTGTPPPKAQAGLKETLQVQGYALACQWVPEEDVELRLPGAEENAVQARIESLSRLNEGVIRLTLALDGQARDFACKPGQYLNLINPDGISRSYSVANDQHRDGFLEFHVGHTEQGLFTRWLFNHATPGDPVHVRGPAGDCFYVPDSEQDFPILLVGTGTGLAPLWGIVNDALAQGHRGAITLLQGAALPQRLYHVEALSALQQQHENFHYRALVLQGAGADPRIREGDIVAETLASLAPETLKSARVFLCGAPDFVQQLRKQVFLKGVNSSHIHCDAFVTRTVAA